MKRRLFVSMPTLFAGALLAACADHGYQCPMPDACAPVHDNYDAARGDASWNGWMAGDPDGSKYEESLKDHKKKKKDKDKDKPAQPAVPAALQVPGRDAAQGPIYAPPRPWLVWLAPYSRADGTLESGTYVWFTSEGHWNYLGRDWQAAPLAGSGGGGAGSLGQSDSGAIHPLYPDQLGFKPGKPVAQKGVLENIAQPEQPGE